MDKLARVAGNVLRAIVVGCFGIALIINTELWARGIGGIVPGCFVRGEH